MSADAVEVRDLRKVYGGGVEALRGVSFVVKRGTVFGLLGPNGAGKTTTQKILCTLLRPTSGSARVMGYDVLSEPGKVRENIGVVFQEPALDDKLTGMENLKYHAMLYGMSRASIERKIREVIELVEMGGWIDRLVQTYSGGMRRKLEIARAIMHEPEVVFLDEPTAGLDAHARKKIWEYIMKIKRERNLTVFLTTHYIEEAERLCDRMAIIDNGRVVVEDSPENIKRRFGKKKLVLVFDSPESRKKGLMLIRKEFTSMRVITEKERVVELTDGNVERMTPEIHELFVKKGVGLVEISIKHPSLEEVYIELTSAERAGENTTFTSPAFIRRRF